MREIVVSSTQIILGRTGDKNSTKIKFDTTQEPFATWKTLWPSGTFTVRHLRPNEYTPYPVTTTIEGNYISWVISEVDTAIAGIGSVEVVFTATVSSTGDTVAKSSIYNSHILYGLDIGEVPSAYTDWVTSINSRVSAVENGSVAGVQYKYNGTAQATPLKFMKCTQAYYDGITPDASTVYFIE